MGIQAALIFNKGLVSELVGANPVAYVLTQLVVLGRRAVVLIGEGAEKAVAVAEGRGGVEAEGFELLGEQAGVLGGVGEELLLVGVDGVEG